VICWLLACRPGFSAEVERPYHEEKHRKRGDRKNGLAGSSRERTFKTVRSAENVSVFPSSPPTARAPQQHCASPKHHCYSADSRGERPRGAMPVCAVAVFWCEKTLVSFPRSAPRHASSPHSHAHRRASTSCKALSTTSPWSVRRSHTPAVPKS
jgi:hypothetical protein